MSYVKLCGEVTRFSSPFPLVPFPFFLDDSFGLLLSPSATTLGGRPLLPDRPFAAGTFSGELFALADPSRASPASEALGGRPLFFEVLWASTFAF